MAGPLPTGLGPVFCDFGSLRSLHCEVPQAGLRYAQEGETGKSEEMWTNRCPEGMHKGLKGNSNAFHPTIL